MTQQPHYQDIFAYFRLALSIGFEDKDAPVAWAERELLRNQVPSHQIIELALAGRQPYSQIIYMLSDFVAEQRDYRLAYKLALARAGYLLEQDAQALPKIGYGLRLLLAESNLGHDLKTQLVSVDNSYEKFRLERIPEMEYRQVLVEFLAHYETYRPVLLEIETKW